LREKLRMRFHPLVAAIVGLTLLMAVTALNPHKYGEDRQSHSAEAQKAKGITSSAPPYAVVARSGDNQTGADLRGEYKPRQPAKDQLDAASPIWTNWIQALSAVAVAVFTLFLWRLQSRQVGLTAQALDESSGATKAMQRQNELTEIAQRPWVTLIPRVTKLESDPGYIRVGIAVDAKNIGQSVALDLRLSVDMRQAARVTDNQMVLARNSVEDASTFKMPVVPNDAVTHQIEATFNSPSLRFDEVGEGEKAVPIAVFATARYRCHGDAVTKVTERSWEIGETADPFEERGIRYPVRDSLTAADLNFHGTGDYQAT
jgi:hypothetical protein